MAMAMYWWLPERMPRLTAEAQATAAVGTLMAVWWMTEALPLPATALLPLVLFPLAGVFPFKQAADPYANRFIFLFMGGFMIALAIQRWNLHHRIALLTVLAVGTKPTRLIGGFMIATAMLSMWISNTATTVMMLPIGLSVIVLLADRVGHESGASPPHSGEESSSGAERLHGFPVCMMLGIAYAANIGGIGTLVGTPPNVFLAAFLQDNLAIDIGFARWMGLGLPLVVLFLFLTWLLLTRVVFPIRIKEIPGGRELIGGELKKLGAMSRGEWTVLCVFLSMATAWVVRGPLTRWAWLIDQLPPVANLDDTIIALIGALSLFLIPVDARRGVFALDWETARRLPWGVLLLFGGGLSLAAAVRSSGLDRAIGEELSALDWLPTMALVVVVTAVVIFLTEVTSNTATATTFLPILAGVAAGIGAEPLVLLVSGTLAASCAFMLPVATPPNAIVYGSGHVRIGQMIQAGFWLNLIGIVLIPLLMYTLGAWTLGIVI